MAYLGGEMLVKQLYTAPSSFRNGHCVSLITLIIMDPLFKVSRILKLNDLYEYQALLFTFDYITNKLHLSFANTFQFNRDKWI